ncbi:MAG TPA: Spx/MgsR family RNA polymerase-binding regulatory protein [Terrimicrobiaceae bacterium]
MLKVYTYANCNTCRKALKFLRDRKITFEEFAIRETPPPRTELEAMLNARGKIRGLFNTSGADYKALGLSERLSKISETEALELLASNGNLVKRPFVSGDGVNLVGFDEVEWRAAFARILSGERVS